MMSSVLAYVERMDSYLTTLLTSYVASVILQWIKSMTIKSAQTIPVVVVGVSTSACPVHK